MRRILLACLAILCFSPTSFASFNIQYLNVSPGLTGTVAWGSQSINVHIGAINMRAYNPPTNPSNDNVVFQTFCIDLSGVMNGNQYAVNIEPISNFPVAPPAIRGRIAYLYDKYGDGNWNSASTTLTNVTAAALQLAFWQLSIGNTATLSFGNISGGNFSTVDTAYTSFLAEVGGVSSSPGAFDNWSGEWLKKVDQSGSGQNVIWSGFPPSNEPPQVPAPGGLVLAAAGSALFSFTGLTRRFRRAV